MQQTAQPARALFESDINEKVPSGNQLLQGATLRTSTAFGRAATVKAGEDIRPALESLKSAGGGTLILLAGVHKANFNIIGTSSINIVGEGRDLTILDFGNGSYSLKYIGTIGAVISNFYISNLTITNSAGNGLEVEYADFWRIDNVRATSNNSRGAYINTSQYGIINNCQFDGNGSYGLDVDGDSISTRSTILTVQNCLAEGNTSHGFVLSTSSGCYVSYLSCISDSNTGSGFYQPITANTRASFFDCRSLSNTGYGYYIGGNFNRLIGCSYISNTDLGLYITGGDNLVIGSEVGDAVTLANETSINTLSAFMTLDEQSEGVTMTNTSGGSVTAGSVVVYKAAAGSVSFTTTTTLGDDAVLGVLVETTANNGIGTVKTKGKTALLKVDGTTDIAIGDFLGTFTTAGIACKATAGDMAFAIALEAYTNNDSNGVIDALIINPRKL